MVTTKLSGVLLGGLFLIAHSRNIHSELKDDTMKICAPSPAFQRNIGETMLVQQKFLEKFSAVCPENAVIA